MNTDIPNIIEAVERLSWRRIWIWVISFLVVAGVVFGRIISYASTYTERVFPGVHIGDVDVGGMTREELRVFLTTMNQKLTDAGITLTFEVDGHTEKVHIDPTIISADSYRELIQMNVDVEVDTLIQYQKEAGSLVKAWSAVLTRVTRPQRALTTVTVDTDQLIDLVSQKLHTFEVVPREAGVIVTDTKPLEYTFVTSTTGITFSYTDIVGKIISSWNVLRIPEVSIVRTIVEPVFTEGEVRSAEDQLPRIFDHGLILLTYTDSDTKREYRWTLYPEKFASWLVAEKVDGKILFGLSASSTEVYLKEVVAHDIDTEAREARFEIGPNGKVSEFQGARLGIQLDTVATYALLNDIVHARNTTEAVSSTVSSTVAVVTTVVEPVIKTSDVNDLGISEILGTGYSNFSGSPTNRVKNIRHAVEDKLNGLLIKPDEEFSLLNALKPFTLEGGYLPELVIKGDEIIPEIAGGLCQVGSTMFRTVMNSGLDVTQRRNHSLVVSYYNDHRNGKPGTDATIYDPAPDFRFKNDTGHYILIKTNMDTKTGDLTFTFWGTNDGRKGYYTEPVVHRWIPTGPEKIIETTKLAPGVRNCQSAHPGAETSFTYVKILPNGEEIKEVFSSSYRSLPKICLVGVAETVQCQELPDGSGCAPPEAEDVAPEEALEEDMVVEESAQILAE